MAGSCTTDSTGQAFTDDNDSVGQPSISGITNVSDCVQSGIQIAYNGGSGASSHDLVRDGAVVVSGYVSNAVYNPGDSNPHTYIVRAVNGSCTNDSGSQAFTDQTGPGQPAITSITDEDGCALSGIRVSYDPGSDATVTICCATARWW